MRTVFHQLAWTQLYTMSDWSSIMIDCNMQNERKLCKSSSSCFINKHKSKNILNIVLLKKHMFLTLENYEHWTFNWNCKVFCGQSWCCACSWHTPTPNRYMDVKIWRLCYRSDHCQFDLTAFLLTLNLPIISRFDSWMSLTFHLSPMLRRTPTTFCTL
jgi:hypothetical protein